MVCGDSLVRRDGDLGDSWSANDGFFVVDRGNRIESVGGRIYEAESGNGLDFDVGAGAVEWVMQRKLGVRLEESCWVV
jgi:hypothetical protein